MVTNKTVTIPNTIPTRNSATIEGMLCGTKSCMYEILCIKMPPETKRSAMVPITARALMTIGKALINVSPTPDKKPLLLDFLIK